MSSLLPNSGLYMFNKGNPVNPFKLRISFNVTDPVLRKLKSLNESPLHPLQFLSSILRLLYSQGHLRPQLSGSLDGPLESSIADSDPHSPLSYYCGSRLKDILRIIDSMSRNLLFPSSLRRCIRRFSSLISKCDHLQSHCRNGVESRIFPSTRACTFPPGDLPRLLSTIYRIALREEAKLLAQQGQGEDDERKLWSTQTAVMPVTAKTCDRVVVRSVTGADKVTHLFDGSFRPKYLSINSDATAHKCGTCEKVFTTERGFRIHFTSVHTVSENPAWRSSGKNNRRRKRRSRVPREPDGHRCEECGKAFPIASKLQRHVETVHKGVKEYECDECGKAFAYSHHLRKHIESVHRGLKLHWCMKCGKSFSRDTYLKNHMDAVHKGMKPYTCKQCSKSFPWSSALKVHVDCVHNQIRRHQCEECGKSFPQACKLRMHTDIVHKGLKRYECEECGRLFPHARNLQLHIENVHKGVRRYPCSDCDKSFQQISRLRAHMASAHNEGVLI